MSTQNPVPGLFLNNPHNVEDPKQALNNQSLLLWSKGVSPRMLAVGGYLSSVASKAPPAPPSDAYLMQAGLGQATFNDSNDGTFTFPQPFPNGTLAFVVMPTAENTLVTISGISTKSTVPLFSLGTTGPLSFSYIAIGW